MKNITLVIPAKEEPTALPMVLNELKKKKIDIKKIIVMNKGDLETRSNIKKYDNCKILFQSKKGYGNAIIEGIDQVKTEYLCIFYADGSTDPIYLDLMLKKLKNQNLDLLFGSRYEKNALSLDDNLVTKIGNYGFTLLGNILMKLNISDLLFTYIFAKTKSLKNLQLKSDDYCLCVEIPFKAKLAKLNYSTIPCIERKRFADKKKVKAFKDGLKILIYLFSKYLKTVYRK